MVCQVEMDIRIVGQDASMSVGVDHSAVTFHLHMLEHDLGLWPAELTKAFIHRYLQQLFAHQQHYDYDCFAHRPGLCTLFLYLCCLCLPVVVMLLGLAYLLLVADAYRVGREPEPKTPELFLQWPSQHVML